MSDLLAPGAERADGVLDDTAVLVAMLAVEEAWSAVLVGRGLAPAGAELPAGTLAGLLDEGVTDEVARAAESSGNPVVPLVALARSRLDETGHVDAATWLHRGLTSQDVLDTALVLGAREAAGRVLVDLRAQADVLRGLATTHRGSVQAARTLTQHAVPTTFGLVVAGWLQAVLDADAGLADAVGALPAQVGGAAGTLAAVVELAVGAGHEDPTTTAVGSAADLADRLGLAAAPPWHVRRRPVTALADALTTCTDTWGAVAASVLVRSRPEVAELREPRPGGSSTMPHKANPVLATLVRRAAITAPTRAALLHTAAALAEDERPAGAWHAEWPALRDVARTAVVAASQATELLTGLVVDADRMRAVARAATSDLLAEQRSVRALLGGEEHPGEQSGGEPDDDAALTGYLGVAHRLVDRAVERAGARPDHPADDLARPGAPR